MDNLRNQMARVVETRAAEAKVSNQKWDEASARRLLQILEKKLQTSFIGAISQFENAFGYLWRHREDEQDLSPEEARFRQLWNEVRTTILNNGNNQIRAIQNELTQYCITWNRHQTTFKADDKSWLLRPVDDRRK